MNRRTLIIICTTILAVAVLHAMGPSIGSCVRFAYYGIVNRPVRHLTHSDILGKPLLAADAGQMDHTIVTPHLQQRIVPNESIVWCDTFQLAWNELCDLAGGPVQMQSAPPMAAILNKRASSKSDLDSSSCVAMAGTVEDGVLDRIRGELDTKLQGQASPDLLKSVPSTGGVVAYSYLLKVLPFQWAFDRFSDKLQFQGKPVESFGIEQLTRRQENEVRASAQVSVLDYQDSDDFIIELKTRVPGDRLILAKVPPSDTLQSTVRAVQNRVSRSKAEPMPESSNLYVPILDFQILKDYDELRGKPLKATNLILNGQSLAIALQSIRFRLDERGAALQSEAALMMCAGMTDLCFDKPFLVLLERNGARNPYLTLWIGNTDLMSPGTPTTM